ncbi:MAG: YggT family protein [Gemmatimonadota bacterium]|nr:YggT family protein [Gemmatimonadota bacterium]MDE3127216.1 YggT family protein [Gemmatimonadota bacterium]MDE3174060.1 YggT family protein [Gemmatimonadota bacterium]MDE3216492.1 YggT family protein [Gemmatimonadota bacterium]
MTGTADAYALFVAGLRWALLALGAAAAAGAAIAWAVRTRRLNPFGWAGRTARRRIDPLLAPVDRMVIRAGGHPTSAPWWGLVALLVAGTLLLTTVQALAGVALQAAWAAGHPAVLPLLLLSWALTLVEVALIVRVVSSWLPIPPYSRWIRWSYPLTEWLLRPLRAIVPPFGMVDLTPVIAYFLLWLVQSLLRLP